MKNVIIVRGGGDIASGVIHKLHRSRFPVLILECAQPTAIRREVSFCEAVYDGESFVEGVLCEKIADISECEEVWKKGEIPLLVDAAGDSIRQMKPFVVVDAILAKKNLGTAMDMAPLTIGLGPGFTAGDDVHYAIETMRGHNLGRIIEEGEPMPNTGIPGEIGGYGAQRVIHAPSGGVFEGVHKIGDWVEAGQTIARIGNAPVPASITGVLRGILRNGLTVPAGMKMADIDPRKGEKENCFTISDKARCIAGSVLELVVREMG
ncbi:MAG: selenium-dependent molybdenum cofactor biosynthesis protein YqeB [Blautia sp.]|jgi:xanthine dehydrogenase accessory factor